MDDESTDPGVATKLRQILITVAYVQEKTRPINWTNEVIQKLGAVGITTSCELELWFNDNSLNENYIDTI